MIVAEKKIDPKVYFTYKATVTERGIYPWPCNQLLTEPGVEGGCCESYPSHLPIVPLCLTFTPPHPIFLSLHTLLTLD